jgi:hypothetical protein
MNANALRLVESPDTSDIENNSLKITDQAQIIEIKNDDDYKKASDVLLLIKDALKEIDSTFGPIKKKSHEAWKEIVAQEKRHQEPLLTAERAVKTKIGSYVQEQQRRKREEEARLLAVAKKREEEARLALAIEVEKSGNKQEAELILNTPAFIPAPIAPALEKVSGVHTRTNWKFRIVDENAIPREYLIPDEKAIAGIVRSLGERTNIPGIQVYPEQVISAGRR